MARATEIGSEALALSKQCDKQMHSVAYLQKAGMQLEPGPAVLSLWHPVGRGYIAMALPSRQSL